MAGLPKRSSLSALVVLFLVLISWACVCQEVQTPSSGLDPVILQVIIDAVDLNPVATDEEKALLVDLFAAPVEDESLDVALVAEMLAAVGWETLDEGIGDVIWLIEGTLAAYAEGLIDDPVAALLDGEETDLTPPGIVTAILNAGASAEIVLQVQALVSSGIPPGIVLRVTKAGLRNEDLDVADALAALAEMFANDPNISPGQAANAVTGNGSNQEQEQNQNEEQEQNENQDENQNEEQEGNQNGSKGGNGKSNGNNGDRGGKKN